MGHAKGNYEAAFVAKLNDCVSVASPKEIAEAAETQTWLEFAVKSEYMEVENARKLYGIYNQILAGFVTMINNRC